MRTINEIQISYKPAFKTNEKIGSSSDCAGYLKKIWEGINLNESFYVLFLNRSNNVKGYYQLSKGGLSSTIVDIRILFGIALKSFSSSIIIAHNHPSGNLNPSNSDNDLTSRILEASKLLDIQLLDHLILSPEGSYFSYADENLMK